jgi:hypothetical protein
MTLPFLVLTLVTTTALGQTLARTPAEPLQNWADPNHSEPAGTHYRTFQSQLAGTEVSYLIYLPPGYETSASRRYPSGGCRTTCARKS